MTDALTQFPPNAKSAFAALAAFVPNAGDAYARMRNHDLGPDNHVHVSTLSPYVKLRLLDEVAVAQAVLEAHSENRAEKFLAEVFWRTYWKGWMELRPSVWMSYLNDINRLQDDIQTQSGLRQRWEAACKGETGIAPFDFWARELVQTGYLHNHARMWFASIWIFTLELPWQLGADFLLRHLLDGDAAVNTLSWRWVAGIQTPGKTYLATPENIAKFTDGRFVGVRGLAPQAIPREGDRPPAGELPPCPPVAAAEKYGVLLHGDDIDLDRLIGGVGAPAAVAYADATNGHSPWQMAPHVGAFRWEAAKDIGATRRLSSVEEIASWAKEQELAQIIAPYAPVGPMQTMLDTYAQIAEAVPIAFDRRPLDSAAWPLATKGFFPFRQHIPKLIGEFVRNGRP